MNIPPRLSIELVNDSPREQAAREGLLNLMKTYDLSRWQYTNRIRISENEIPHSHPILTLNGHDGFAHPLRLLSSFLHEQLHWFWLLAEHGDSLSAARAELGMAFPNLPLDPPAGCGDEDSNYLHIPINYWELDGLASLLGVEPARAFIARKPYYQAIYQLVLNHTDQVGDLLANHWLLVPERPPEKLQFLETIDD